VEDRGIGRFRAGTLRALRLRGRIDGAGGSSESGHEQEDGERPECLGGIQDLSGLHVQLPVQSPEEAPHTTGVLAEIALAHPGGGGEIDPGLSVLVQGYVYLNVVHEPEEQTLRFGQDHSALVVRVGHPPTTELSRRQPQRGLPDSVEGDRVGPPAESKIRGVRIGFDPVLREPLNHREGAQRP
jgi:hypothetical protein